jgi:outer membrane protein W
MKKKLVLALLMATLLAGGGFAQEGVLSAGGGVSLVPSFGEMKYKGGLGSAKTSGFGFAINVFLDAKYAEMDLGILFDSFKYDAPGSSNIDTTDLIITFVGKYPFSLSDQLALFPFAGIDFKINLAAKSGGNEIKDEGDFKKADYFNALSTILGVGLDYSMTDAMYIRTEIGYGIILNTKDEDKRKNSFDSNIKGKIPIKVAVGYRF